MTVLESEFNGRLNKKPDNGSHFGLVKWIDHINKETVLKKIK